MGLRMFVTDALQNRLRPDRSRRTARGTLASWASHVGGYTRKRKSSEAWFRLTAEESSSPGLLLRPTGFYSP